MKKLFTLFSLSAVLLFFNDIKAQEVGFGVGTSNYFGDLGRQGMGNSYVSDLWIEETKPSFTLFYRYSFLERFAVKSSLSLGWIGADDALISDVERGDDAWFRQYRNLHFKSHIFELSVMGEVNILPYAPGSYRDRFTPYITGGISVFHFDPKAEYNGEWVRLQPLGTEGQNTPEYPDRQKYSLIQPAIPLGLGVKYNINNNLILNFEVAHRFTFTDYLDDVSLDYVDRRVFDNNYETERADMIFALSNRSGEVDVEGVNRNVTAPGQQRGNPAGNDAFVFTTIALSYYFGNPNNNFTDPRMMRRHRLRW
jgi:hypothetical protein